MNPSISATQSGVSEGITYYLNRVQGLESRQNYFVTLGEPVQRTSQVHTRVEYERPIYDLGAVSTQTQLTSMQGERDTYFCGSYFGFGFHEDAVRSGLDVAKLLAGNSLQRAKDLPSAGSRSLR